MTQIVSVASNDFWRENSNIFNIKKYNQKYFQEL